MSRTIRRKDVKKKHYHTDEYGDYVWRPKRYRLVGDDRYFMYRHKTTNNIWDKLIQIAESRCHSDNGWSEDVWGVPWEYANRRNRQMRHNNKQELHRKIVDFGANVWEDGWLDWDERVFIAKSLDAAWDYY